jgi:hypothetical protein
MFAIFPTISILDTLDKSGKYAFTSFSMALTLSFVKPILINILLCLSISLIYIDLWHKIVS